VEFLLSLQEFIGHSVFELFQFLLWLVVVDLWFECKLFHVLFKFVLLSRLEFLLVNLGLSIQMMASWPFVILVLALFNINLWIECQLSSISFFLLLFVLLNSLWELWLSVSRVQKDLDDVDFFFLVKHFLSSLIG